MANAGAGIDAGRAPCPALSIGRLHEKLGDDSIRDEALARDVRRLLEELSAQIRGGARVEQRAALAG